MFRGEFKHNIDAKGRLMFPIKFRQEIGENFVVTKEIGGCLSVYSEQEWKALETKLEQLPKSKANIARFYMGSAVDSGLDKLGRILLSPALKEYAGLDKEVVIAGVLGRIEIWDKQRWDDNNALIEANIEDEMADLGF